MQDDVKAWERRNSLVRFGTCIFAPRLPRKLRKLRTGGRPPPLSAVHNAEPGQQTLIPPFRVGRCRLQLCTSRMQALAPPRLCATRLEEPISRS